MWIGIFLFSQKNWGLASSLPIGHNIATSYLLYYWPFYCLDPTAERRPTHVKTIVNPSDHFSVLWFIQHINTPSFVLYTSALAWGKVYAGWQAGEHISGLGLRLCRPGTNDNSRSWTTGKLGTLFSLPPFPCDPFTYLVHPLLLVTKVKCIWIQIYVKRLVFWALNPIVEM